ncbi:MULTISPECIES: DUF6327 family protein [Croceibacter]|jgi:hypothetical protein|uniref:Glutaminyl-tRNA synthetase n=1 Tax=Croceibacter atlanticus (strain ATCC BAA-628 / JCM 21780 / CIP 108009 / IAM 15332 / KCTC 12090 / HTCC2559) TaxID=216432 RepID=A3U6A1_CROAH|nr:MULTISPECIES: DUF6327 family protein [Croceibacter]HAT70445.1 hypothetical protein [Flavobacteriaceae bacterium]EAP87768.1 glutaminyl-tRNA synthetase [Croceibacter atlanticus HTCC2559]MAM22983.1 hypothetical protein [Croceibacter sp.]MBG25291.1 hypothetical protein [Croceibacter sp.]MBW4970001.1 hypothetical protein [Croceibacter atlanticus]|tara:strand:+ start:186 stop:428 length:243 start_codon:yes stop_codon:yes gene_type:complete
MKKIYSSFDEIDKDLKILKLQKDIDLEEVKISYHEVKNSLSPIGLISNVAGAIAQKAFVLKAVNKLLGIKRVKKVDDAKI